MDETRTGKALDPAKDDTRIEVPLRGGRDPRRLVGCAATAGCAAWTAVAVALAAGAGRALGWW